MATLESLKNRLRQKAQTIALSPMRPLSALEYCAGFESMKKNLSAYEKFIVPQLAEFLSYLVEGNSSISVLEIGPGPQSILTKLPFSHKSTVSKYTAFEPNAYFADRLEASLSCLGVEQPPFPNLESTPHIERTPFTSEVNENFASSTHVENFDLILFCHSMYDMKPKRKFIERALEMLVEAPRKGLVVVFHRDSAPKFDGPKFGGLICHKTATFPEGLVSVADDDEVLNHFAPFIAGSVMEEPGADGEVKGAWREICRALAKRKWDRLSFRSPNIMVSFTRHATALPALKKRVPAEAQVEVKNRQARLHLPACIVRPTEIAQIQHCVNWALDHEVGLTVLGGGHSGHCLWSSVVSVDMCAFNTVKIIQQEEDVGSLPFHRSLIIAGAGCKTGDITREATAAGLAIPLGARPSVGGGLWLQGGIGHLARLYGLSCDAMVGAVVVSVRDGHVFCVGQVPKDYQPAGSIRPDNNEELLWALKGAGTNFGIVVTVVFGAYPAPAYSVRHWVAPLTDNIDAQLRLGSFDKALVGQQPLNVCLGVYLYGEEDTLHLGVMAVESRSSELVDDTCSPVARQLRPRCAS